MKVGVLCRKATPGNSSPTAAVVPSSRFPPKNHS